MEKSRIQKYLSEAGVSSRREVEEMVIQGRIMVNGRLVNELPCFIDPAIDKVTVDGKAVHVTRPQSVYFLLNKPHGVVCTQRDPRGRTLAIELVPTIAGRVYCVGGLDDEATGLVIITNDGELTARLTDPRLGLEMTYVVEVDGRPDESANNELKHGQFVEGRRRPGIRLKVLDGSAIRSVLEIQSPEGRNALVRYAFQRIGHRIRRMKRTAIGPITERGLKIGHFRALTPREVEQLYALAPQKKAAMRGPKGIGREKPKAYPRRPPARPTTLGRPHRP